MCGFCLSGVNEPVQWGETTVTCNVDAAIVSRSGVILPTPAEIDAPYLLSVVSTSHFTLVRPLGLFELVQ
jgi:hypothetical protein